MVNLQGLNGIAAIVAAGVVARLLSGRPRWQRWTTSFLVALAVGGALGYTEAYINAYNQRHDPAAANIAIEKEFERLAPTLIGILRQEDPQAWADFMSRASQQIVASGGNPSTDDMNKLSKEFRTMGKRVWSVVSQASDDTILALARQDIVVDETLKRETIKMCDTRGAPLWNLNDLPSASLKSVQEFMDLTSTAYRQGKGRQQQVQLTDDDAAGLLKRAVSWRDAPLSDEDVDYFNSGANTDPGRQCRLRLQFEKNVMSISENAALFRWLYAHSIQ